MPLSQEIFQVSNLNKRCSYDPPILYLQKDQLVGVARIEADKVYWLAEYGYDVGRERHKFIYFCFGWDIESKI